MQKTRLEDGPYGCRVLLWPVRQDAIAPPRPWSASGRHPTEWPDGVQRPPSRSSRLPGVADPQDRQATAPSNFQIPVPGRGVKDPPCVFQHVVSGHAGLYRVDLEELLAREPVHLDRYVSGRLRHLIIRVCCHAAQRRRQVFFLGG